MFILLHFTSLSALYASVMAECTPLEQLSSDDMINGYVYTGEAILLENGTVSCKTEDEILAVSVGGLIENFPLTCIDGVYANDPDYSWNHYLAQVACVAKENHYCMLAGHQQIRAGNHSCPVGQIVHIDGDNYNETNDAHVVICNEDGTLTFNGNTIEPLDVNLICHTHWTCPPVEEYPSDQMPAMYAGKNKKSFIYHEYDLYVLACEGIPMVKTPHGILSWIFTYCKNDQWYQGDDEGITDFKAACVDFDFMEELKVCEFGGEDGMKYASVLHGNNTCPDGEQVRVEKDDKIYISDVITCNEDATFTINGHNFEGGISMKITCIPKEMC